MALEPLAALANLRSSTSAFLAGLAEERWGDNDAHRPSLLPGWTRAHVLTHVARNADGIARTLAGALRGERVARYPHGTEGRNADIEAGAARDSIELLADVRDSAERLDRVFAAVADTDGWDLPTDDRPAGDYAAARWREVEIHRVDLGGTYVPADWPPAFVSYLLDAAMPTLPERCAEPVTVRIAAHRSVCPDLAGREWPAPSGDSRLVEGPDWAVAAWLAGRAHAAARALSAAPELSPWL